MIQYQTMVNDFLETLGAEDLMIDVDLDEEVFIQINDEQGIGISYDPQFESTIVRVYFGEIPEEVSFLLELLSLNDLQRIGGNPISFGVDLDAGSAYASVTISDEDIELELLELTFVNLIEICSWFNERKEGEPQQLPNEERAEQIPDDNQNLYL